MSHKDVLKLLFPLDLGGVFEPDIEIEGARLDTAQAAAATLLTEMYPDTTIAMLPFWEMEYGLVPGSGETLQARRDRLLAKIRSRGGLSRAYFIDLAAAMGYMITIDELQPFTVDSPCDGTLYDESVRFCWRANVSGYSLYYSTVDSPCDEPLLWWPAQTELEALFNALKPARSYIIFDYS